MATPASPSLTAPPSAAGHTGTPLPPAPSGSTQPNGAPAPAAPAPAPPAAQASEQPLPTGTFTSILPLVEELLGKVYGVSEGEEGEMDGVVAKAKEITARLSAMRAAADKLPGGQMGTDAVVRLTEVLEQQAEEKRAVLRAFAATRTPMADAEEAPLAEGGEGATDTPAA